MHGRLAQAFFKRGALFALLCVLCSSCGNRQITGQTEKIIENSPELQQVDQICSQIPLPPGFQFVRKERVFPQKITLSYSYRAETEYETARALWTNYLIENGWRKIREDEGDPKILEFRNAELRAAFAHGNFGQTNYSITCEKLAADSE